MARSLYISMFAAPTASLNIHIRLAIIERTMNGLDPMLDLELGIAKTGRIGYQGLGLRSHATYVPPPGPNVRSGAKNLLAVCNLCSGHSLRDAVQTHVPVTHNDCHWLGTRSGLQPHCM
jgi:hypothetical protein